METADSAYWVDVARMGIEEWVGLEKRPAGRYSSVWYALLVRRRQKTDKLIEPESSEARRERGKTNIEFTKRPSR